MNKSGIKSRSLDNSGVIIMESDELAVVYIWKVGKFKHIQFKTIDSDDLTPKSRSFLVHGAVHEKLRESCTEDLCLFGCTSQVP